MIIRRGSKILFRVERAGNLIFKILGLMGRKKLPRNGGMLFEFPFEYRWSMWMFGMRFSVDMIFLDKYKKIMGLEKSVKPFDYDPTTWKIVKPIKKCKYVLEINANEINRKSIKIGNKLKW